MSLPADQHLLPADSSDIPIEHAAGDSNVREPGTVVYYQEGDDGLTLDERWRDAVRPSPVSSRSALLCEMHVDAQAWYNLFINTPIQVTKLPGVDYPKDAVWQPTGELSVPASS